MYGLDLVIKGKAISAALEANECKELSLFLKENILETCSQQCAGTAGTD